MDGAVFLSIFDWWYSSHGHSDIQLARAFARRMPVLFVNSIGMRIPRPGNATAPIKRIVRKLGSGLRPLTFPDTGLNLAVVSPFPLPIYAGPLEPIVRTMLRVQIRLAMRRLRISAPFVIVTVPTFAKVALAIPRDLMIYYRGDRHSAFPGVNAEMLRCFEGTLFQSADATLYSNRDLFDLEAPLLGGRAHLIGHGVDTSAFAPSGAEAAELRDLPRPLVGFFGELRERAVDFDLVAAVARLCPSVQFVLGGPRLDDVGQLRACSNVHIVDACAHARMPERWRALDAAIMPYKLNAWSEAIEPIKLAEILSTGLRAVGTPVPALKQHPDVVTLARGPAEFAAALQAILADPDHRSVAARAANRARTPFKSWDAIAEEVIGLAKASGEHPAANPPSRAAVS